jgi:hypothetical protein
MMILRTVMMSAAAVALMAGAPALAQTKSPASSAQSSSPNPGSTQSTMPGQSASLDSARSAKAVEDSLRQAGLQDLKIMDSAYLVSAKTKGGEQVTLFIDPPNAGSHSNSASSQSTGTGAGSSSQAMTGQEKVKKTLQEAGFTDVAVLDAAYLVSGKTSAGDHVTMMVDPGTATGSVSPSGKIGPSSSAPAPAAGSSSEGSKASGASGSTTKP